MGRMGTSRASARWSQWILLATAFSLTTGCNKRGMKRPAADGGNQDLASATDGVSRESAETTAADSRLQPDSFPTGPDVAPGEDVKSADSAEWKDVRAADLAEPDGAMATEDATDAPVEHATATDGSFLPEAPVDMPSSLDAPVPVDLQPDAGMDASPFPWDITLFPNKDFGVADQQCIDGTALWLNRIATYLDEDRKCWVDEDCWVRLPEFKDPCGLICTFPINHQREYEFIQKVNEYAKQVCASCPRPESYPACPPRTGNFWCNAGRCEYR